MTQKDTELSNNKKYEKALKKKIVEYARRNKNELCRRGKILTYVANDLEVQEARKSRKYARNDNAYTAEEPDDASKSKNNKRSDTRKVVEKYYEDMFDDMLEELVEQGKIRKVLKPGTKRVFYYTYGASKPSVSSVEDKEIAVFKVVSGNVKVAADIVKGNLKKESEDRKIDENIEVTVAGKYLLCEIKDLQKYGQGGNQLLYIRERVKKALELAGCTFEIKK